MRLYDRQEHPWERLPAWVVGIAWVGAPSAALFYVLWRIEPAMQRLADAIQALAAQQASLAELIRLTLR